MAFDLNKFLNTTYTEEFDTKRPLMPEGEWRGYVRTLDAQPGTRENTLMLRVTIEYDDEDLKKEESVAGRDKIMKNETIFVDLDDNGLIKHGGGQNWMLGQLRAAVGQNNPGKAWSPSMLEGAGPLITKITHRELKKDDGSGKKVGTGEVIDNIAAFAPA